MAIGKSPPTDAKEYGDKKKEAQDEAALAATAQMEAETAPQVEVPTAQAATQQPAPEQGAPPASTPQQQRVRPRNLMQIVPPNLLYRDRSKKSSLAKSYDVGTLWEVLANAPDAPASIRAIAQRLMSKE
jgi:hypothetical protein